jgi:hypothetical protein
MVNGKTLIEYAPTSLAAEEIKIIWEKMKNSIFKEENDSVK